MSESSSSGWSKERVAASAAVVAVEPVPAGTTDETDQLRARIASLEQALLESRSHRGGVTAGGAARGARQPVSSSSSSAALEELKARHRSQLLQLVEKRRIADESKRHYNLLLKSLACHTFHRDQQLRAKLVQVISQLHTSLDEAETEAWQRAGRNLGRAGATIDFSHNRTAPSPSPPSTTSTRPTTVAAAEETTPGSPAASPTGRTSKKQQQARRLVLVDTARSNHESASSTTPTTASSPLTPSPPASSPPAAASPSPYAASFSSSSSPSSPVPSSQASDRLLFLSSGDAVTLRDADDHWREQGSRRRLITDIVRRPRQKLRVLLDTLSDSLVGQLDTALRELRRESAHARRLADTHLQSIIALSEEKAAGASREERLKIDLAQARTERDIERATVARQAARIVDLQHEAHVAASRRATEEQKQIVEEQRSVAALVDRSHALRRKVRDSEATLAALEKKKARLERQGFVTGTASSPTNTAVALATAGIGGGGLGLLSMAMMATRDELARAQQALASLAIASDSPAGVANAAAETDLPPPDLRARPRGESKEEEKMQLVGVGSGSGSAPMTTVSPRHALSRGSSLGHERSAPPHSPKRAPSIVLRAASLPVTSESQPHQPHAGSTVTQATIGRLQLTLPIVPLYASSTPDRTRPMSTRATGASIDYAGVTGLGVSAGLRHGQRLERRLGDFDRMAVAQITATGHDTSGTGSSSGSVLHTPVASHGHGPHSHRQAKAHAVGSSTGSVVASANVAPQRFVATAYKHTHVPGPYSPSTPHSPRPLPPPSPVAHPHTLSPNAPAAVGSTAVVRPSVTYAPHPYEPKSPSSTMSPRARTRTPLTHILHAAPTPTADQPASPSSITSPLLVPLLSAQLSPRPPTTAATEAS